MKKRYTNIDEDDHLGTFKDILKWQRSRPKKVIDFAVPQHANKELSFLQTNRTHQTITWIGHSTFFIQKEGLNILTDPVWANRMGFSKRLTAPGLPLGEMPNIDVVLISHGHYDHLHINTLKRIKGNPLFIIPEGLGNLFKRHRMTNYLELAWYEQHTIGELQIHFVPAKHWTRRMLWDTNSSHWGGYVLQTASDDNSIYFAGDSGYFRGFKEIGERFTIHTALMPIGAYEPEWFMHPSHVTPEEAIQAFRDVGAKVFIPMHYGAFMLADDTPREALDRLEEAWSRIVSNTAELKQLELGETIKYEE